MCFAPKENNMRGTAVKIPAPESSKIVELSMVKIEYVVKKSKYSNAMGVTNAVSINSPAVADIETERLINP